MDITPIFCPPTPPKAGFFFLAFFFLFQSVFAEQKTAPSIQTNKLESPSGWVMYFLPLQEFPKHTSLQYVRELSVLLKQSKNQKIKNRSIPKIISDDLEEPVFKRIEWNRMATDLNKFCLNNGTETCKQLAQHRSQYYVQYQKFVGDRKKWRKKKLRGATTPVTKTK